MQSLIQIFEVRCKVLKTSELRIVSRLLKSVYSVSCMGGNFKAPWTDYVSYVVDVFGETPTHFWVEG